MNMFVVFKKEDGCEPVFLIAQFCLIMFSLRVGDTAAGWHDSSRNNERLCP